MNPKPAARRTAAFTLIELLVVISIIALLIGILLPALGSARKAARNTVCLTQARQLGTAYATWLADNDYGMIPQWPMDIFDDGGYLDVEADRNEIQICPETSRAQNAQQAGGGTGAGGWFGTSAFAWRKEFRAAQGEVPSDGSYQYNAWLFTPGFAGFAGVPTASPTVRNTMLYETADAIRDTTRTPFVGDGCWIAGGPGEFYPTTYLPSVDLEDPIRSSGGWNATKAFVGYLVGRHGQTINMSFVDGSARAVPRAELWALTWHRNYDLDHANIPDPADIP